ncbi:MAG: glycosyltransferase family 2 protein, partial [Endomicrobiaceae bacterium]|nr:glycosyltransferase family 2 protein [Endomicrobiaceae bacterium]
PCYNESITIKKVIEECRKYLADADIYVYDNNSTDGTDEIAKKAGAIVRYETKQGKGSVIRRMFREIDADCYVMIDGDLQCPLENIKEMCQLILNGQADMVIADRLSESYFSTNKRIFHNMGNVLVRTLVNKLFNSNIKDIMCGYRVMNRIFVKSVPILSNGFEIETEMTIHALDKNFTIKQIPVKYKERPEGSVSKLHTFSDGFLVLKMIISLFKDYKPFIFFTAVSLFLFLCSMVLFVPVFIEFLETSKVPRFPTLIVSGVLATMSLLMWICGIILQTIVRKHNELYEIMLKHRYR